MRCVMCNRAIFAKCHFVAGHPIGPVCYKKRFPQAPKMRKEHAHRDEKTLDLFQQVGVYEEFTQISPKG